MHSNDFSFSVHPSSGVPIYRQIMDQVVALVLSGQLTAGDNVPSTRKLAATLEVNMMTVSKAYARLESEGVLNRIRGRGMIVAEPVGGVSTTVKHRQVELYPLVEQAVRRGLQLQLTERQIIAVVQSVLRENRNE